MRHHESIQERVAVVRRAAVFFSSIAAFVSVTVVCVTSGAGEIGFAFAVVAAPVFAAIVAAIHVAAIRAASGVEVAAVGVAQAFRRVRVAIASGSVVIVVGVAVVAFVFARATADAPAVVQVVAMVVAPTLTGAAIFGGVAVAFAHVAFAFVKDVVAIAFVRAQP